LRVAWRFIAAARRDDRIGVPFAVAMLLTPLLCRFFSSRSASITTPIQTDDAAGRKKNSTSRLHAVLPTTLAIVFLIAGN